MSSDLILKLRTDEEVLRTRVDASTVKNMTDINEYILQTWPELGRLYEDYRVYYIDDFDEKCLLNELSVQDALTLAKIRAQASGSVPVLELYIEVLDHDDSEAESEELAANEVEDPEETLAKLLEDLGYVVSSEDALSLVDSLGETGIDLDKLREQLEIEKNGAQETAEKIAPAVETKKPAVKAPAKGEPESGWVVDAVPEEPDEGLHIVKTVSNDKDAVSTMVDLLTQLGFVDNRETAQELVNRLVSSSNDVDRISKRIMDLAEQQEQERSGEATEEAVKDANDEELSAVKRSSAAKDLENLLYNMGFVETREAAKDIVAALVGAGQDLRKVIEHFEAEKPSKRTTESSGSQTVSRRRRHHSRRGASQKKPAASTSKTSSA
ncbi:hypothetical protein FOL47_006670 [Perkinsus chesapeaki]|uniref:Uncharacterized protein n=1 Tax=Perkinsus chesapeaki TaxID=330153 RepID=A0A7J6LQ80_PERCH|nr:hypothetical protein FOL47_006670 [Perkinsus chesapeaki]